MGILCAHLYKLLSHCHYLVTFMDPKSLQSSLFATLWTVAHNSQAPWCMGFSRQQYWSGLLCPLPVDLPNPGTKPRSPALQVDSLPSEPLGKPKNIGVGSLSFLQGNFLTQKSNHGLLHYQLNTREDLFIIVYG